LKIFFIFKCKTFLSNGTSVEAIDCVNDDYDILCCKITNTTAGTPEACCNRVKNCHNPQGYDPKYLSPNPETRGNFQTFGVCGNKAYACAVSVSIF
jgi:hypothetical protein